MPESNVAHQVASRAPVPHQEINAGALIFVKLVCILLGFAGMGVVLNAHSGATIPFINMQADLAFLAGSLVFASMATMWAILALGYLTPRARTLPIVGSVCLLCLSSFDVTCWYVVKNEDSNNPTFHVISMRVPSDVRVCDTTTSEPDSMLNHGRSM